MFKLSKTLNKIFRKYQEDLWGSIRLQEKSSNVGKLLASLVELTKKRYEPFFFVINVAPPIRRKKRLSAFGKMLETRKKLCIFYGGLRTGAYVKLGFMANQSKNSLNGDFIVSLLERSLAFSLYRANFVSSLGLSLLLVRNGFVMVDKEVVTRTQHIVNYGSVVELIPHKKEEYFSILTSRLSMGHVLCIQPLYLMINYFSMSFFFYDNVKVDNVFYPFDVPKYFFISDFLNRY